MKVVMARVGLLLTALGLPVRAEVLTVTSPVRAKMPEPLLTESITDLDGALPFSGGVRFGIRHRWLTVRTFLGAGAGGHSAHAVPLRAQAAVLAELGREGRLGCAGFEMDADWARRMPPTLAMNFILRGAHLHVPFDLGIAVPWTPQSRYGDASVGVLVRLILEIDHD